MPPMGRIIIWLCRFLRASQYLKSPKNTIGKNWINTTIQMTLNRREKRKKKNLCANYVQIKKASGV